MKKLIIILISFLLLWGGWYLCCPYYLMWLEGFSFFSTLPDFGSVSLTMKDNFFHYLGAFLLQFYSSALSGAAVQALLPLAVVLSIWVSLKRIFVNSDSMFWLPFIAMPPVVHVQIDDITLATTSMLVASSVALAVLVYIVTCFVKSDFKFPAVLRHNAVMIMVPLACTLVSLHLVRTAPLCSKYDELTRLIHMAEHERWDDIIQSVSRKDALSNEYKRKYMLLSLIETDRLPEYAFKYGLSSSNDFVFTGAADPLALKYNTMYYRSLGLYNAVIYYAYQQSLQSLPGISFDAVRTLADAYLALKDYTLAKKYIDVVSHSLFSKRWVDERCKRLDAIRGSDSEYVPEGQRFILQDFYKDMSALVTRYPREKKYADILLCALLADKEGHSFLSVFDKVYESLYKDAPALPELYQEALCMVARHEPQVLELYGIDEGVWKRYNDFAAMMSQGKTSQAMRKYADTYWVYSYR